MNPSHLQWLSLLNGQLTLGHRPGKKLLAQLPNAQVTSVGTLLWQGEGAEPLGEKVKDMGLLWLWLPLHTAQPPGKNRLEEVKGFFGQLEKSLQEGHSIYLHCSAGIHRTGMISYAFLRHLGWSREKAHQGLGQMREITGKEVGDARLAWGDQFAQ